MTHKERIMRAIKHTSSDRVATDFWATVEVQERLCEHLGIETGAGEHTPGIGFNGGRLSRGLSGITELLDTLSIDCMFHVSPPYIGPEIETRSDMTANEWGFGYRDKKYRTGTYTEQVHHPLAEAKSVAEIDAYQWPQPEWYDYSALPSLIERCGDRAITVGYSAIFTYHNYLRGLEQSLMDPVLVPDIAHRIIERLADFFAEYHTRCFESAAPFIDTHQVTDDWGSQNGLIVSPQIFREFYKDRTKQAIDLAKRFDIYVFHHDDGDCRALIPELTDMGIDILNPIQYRCGNWDLAQLKREFGDRLCFHSAVDNQQLLPLGSTEDVRAEVRMLVDTLASDGTGFILGPCHNLQPNTPTENIIAMYDEAKNYEF